MIEKKLSSTDKKRIKADMNLKFMIVTLLILGLILLFTIGAAVAYAFGVRPVNGFGTRALITIGLLSSPLFLIAWKNIIKLIDLRTGLKMSIRTSDYDIIKGRDGYTLLLSRPKLKLELDDAIAPMLRPTESIIIEVAKFSRTLVFISQDGDNLLEKLDRTEGE